MEQKLFLIRTKLPEYFHTIKLAFAEVVVIAPELYQIGLQNLQEQDVVLFYATKSPLDEKISAFLKENCPERWLMVLEKASIHAIRSAYEGGAVKVLFADEVESELEETLRLVQEETLQKAIRNLPKHIKKSHLEPVEKMTRLQQLDDVREIVRRLRDNLAQHGGLGAVLSTAELLRATAQESQDGFLIPRDLFQGFVNSSQAANRTFEAMSYFIRILDKKPNIKEHFLPDIFRLWDTLAAQISEKAALAGIKLIITREYDIPDILVRTDVEQLEIILQETMVNALKFSLSGDSVIFIPVVRQKEYGFFLLNPAHSYHGVVGIPPDYKKKIFEPLFKIQEIQDHLFTEYELTAGLGLGLTMIERLIKNLGGEIFLSNITTHSIDQKSKNTRVLTEVLLPVH